MADRYVVLKIVSEALAEPDCMAQLQHTNIVPIYSSHRVLSRSVICMPYTGSVTLADFLKCKTDVTSRIGESLVTTVKAKIQDTQTAASPTDAASLADVLELPAAHEGAVQRPLEVSRPLDCCQLATWIYHRVAGALSHAHARDVLHNDLKPSNVLIRNDGEPALLDFNLSQSISTRTARHAGGTLPYMSPESHRALMGQETPAHPATDIYSLGVMLFEFVTGRLPFPPSPSAAPIDLSPAIEARRQAPEWRADDQVTTGLRVIVNRCLQFEPEDRYRSADQLQTDLLCEQENRALVHASEPVVNRCKKFWRRHPRLVAVSLASVLFLGVLGPVAYQLSQTRDQYQQLASQTALKEFAEESAPYLCLIPGLRGSISWSKLQRGCKSKRLLVHCCSCAPNKSNSVAMPLPANAGSLKHNGPSHRIHRKSIWKPNG